MFKKYYCKIYYINNKIFITFMKGWKLGIKILITTKPGRYYILLLSTLHSILYKINVKLSRK